MEDKELLLLIFLQQILSKLEESYFTVFTTPTGFGAVFLAIFSVTRPGDEIIVADPVYSPTRLLSRKFFKRI
jgi:cystathionine beta-lyase